jgi:WS/DGAT/MGAT family acyltransferase
LLWLAGLNLATLPLRLAQPLGNSWTALKATVKTFAGEFLGKPHAFPTTRFNTEVSPHRVFETRRFALEDFKAIRALVPGASVNDVVLAVCAGGLRGYLYKQDELPLQSLVAAAPVAVHSDLESGSESDRRSGNYSWVRVGLGTDIADPVQRLAAIQQASSSSEVMAQALSARELTLLAQQAPSLAIVATSKMLRSASALLGDWAPLANCAITNVPGSREPLYLLGARLSYLSAIMPISDGMGLVFSVTGYNGTIVVSFTSCYEQLPDPEVLAQCLRDSFQEYLALAQAVSPRKPVAVARKKPVARKKAATLA